ncbi:MAG: hypothetical protein ACRDSI_15675 [Pseudonocardiaceae bacterium]
MTQYENEFSRLVVDGKRIAGGTLCTPSGGVRVPRTLHATLSAAWQLIAA